MRTLKQLTRAVLKLTVKEKHTTKIAGALGSEGASPRFRGD